MRVKQGKAKSTQLPRDLPSLAVLGLTDPGDGDWATLRGLQYSVLARAPFLRAMVHGAAAIAVAAILWTQIGIPFLAVWIAVLAATLFHAAIRDGHLADADRRDVTRDEVNRHAISSIVGGLVWAAPVAAAFQLGEIDAGLQVWAVLAALMTAMVIVLPAVPLSSLLFIGIAGLGGVANFALQGNFAMAAVAFGHCLALGFGTLAGARSYLVAAIAEAGMAEKNEVVSLLLREFEEGEADWLWQIDTARRVRSISPRFAFALGMDSGQIEGKPLIQLIAGSAWETGQFPSSLHDLAERLKRRESFSNLLVRVTIKGEQRWWELSGTPKIDDNGVFDGFRGVGSDVTEQRESSDKIAHMARYDTLTGLPNRMMLNEALGDAMRYADQWRTRCAFLMIDLDRFKAVNDTLGHLVGDQLLAQVSARLKEQMTDNELCGRLGGDEFAIVVRDASDLGRVERVAERLIERLSQPYEVDHHTLYVGASIGSAIGPRDGSTVETLMRNADLALYRSKEEGGGCHHNYEPALHAHAEERRKLEYSLRRALERNEFVLNYQPVVDATSEAVVSFEALIRWNSQEHGFVSPGKFIPLAEDTRLIVPIGEWVLREACVQAARWPSQIKVAVNASAEQLLDPNFAASIVGALVGERACAPTAGDRGYREHFRSRCQPGPRLAGADHGIGLQCRARRFRNRLLVAWLYPEPAFLHHQDRPHICSGRSHPQPGKSSDHSRRRCDGRQPRDVDDCRRR